MANLIIKINVTVSFTPTAAEIKQIVNIRINVTIDFLPTAAEMEQIANIIIKVTIDFWFAAAEIQQIVTLIANIKRIYTFLFTFAINVTMCSMSAAVGQK